MAKASENDRRESPRYATSMAVGISVEYRHLGRPHESHEDIARNVSSGGVFLETTVALEVGTIVDLEIHSQSKSEPIHFNAEVIRVETEPGSVGSTSTKPICGMALRFLNPDTKEVERLLALAKEMESLRTK